MPREYFNKTHQTHILESFADNLINVTVKTPPRGYDAMDAVAKTNVDLTIANSMIDILVKRCPNSEVEILQSTNISRMCALILVCEQRGVQCKIVDLKNNSTLAHTSAITEQLKQMRLEKNDTTTSIIEASHSRDLAVKAAPVHEAKSYRM